jgi:hypothetical protein
MGTARRSCLHARAGGVAVYRHRGLETLRPYEPVPVGLLLIGEALCSHNPIGGQGVKTTTKHIGSTRAMNQPSDLAPSQLERYVQRHGA